MLEKTITVTLPEVAFRRLQRAAELTHRSVDDILVGALDATLSAPPDLPAELADELAAMALFSDAALQAAGESSLSPAQRRRMGQLTQAGKARPLTSAESAELAQLLEWYDRSVLRRARALAILSLRGYVLPDRVDLPDSTPDDDDYQDSQAAQSPGA